MWTTPRTWTTGEVVTAAMLNTHVRDNLNFLHDRHSCIVFKSADQTGIVTATPTLVDWDSENHDSDGFHDNATNNERLTIPTGLDGFVLLWCGLQWVSDPGGAGTREIQFFKNTATDLKHDRVAAFVGIIHQIGVCFDIAVATDYYWIKAFQDSGANRALDGGSSLNSAFGLVWLSA